MTRVWLRWLPAAVVPALIAAGAVAGSLPATGALPAKTPAEVLAMVESNTVRALSGTVEQTSELGLPRLPEGGPTAGAASVLELLTGSHTARVYLDGPANVRLQLLDTLAERDVVRQGRDLWFYDWRKNAATHLSLPAGTATEHVLPEQTPGQLAERFLAAVGPGTEVTVDSGAAVAGRSAYELVLVPDSTATLIGSVAIAVDARTGLPLRVEVQARGQQEPAFRLGFTELSLQAPDAALFAFRPPAGTAVTEKTLPDKPPAENPLEPGPPSGAHRPTVSGSGWDTVIGVPAADVPADLLASPLLAQASTAVPGGRMFSSALVTVLLTDDGRLFAGAVPPDRLQEAAGSR